ncbi:uncharacterized protein LOC62_06G007855 [Vanrija pseudolonga]|uniref:Uncharacterized protein n=1 Tax=Vanrija pseudolonga TaxID=143232 RepID=A0AAF0YCR9_9TREE|nr:hypothetical protein LOC62_06G007855 [Vanrija pseudolonga]
MIRSDGGNIQIINPTFIINGGEMSEDDEWDVFDDPYHPYSYHDTHDPHSYYQVQPSSWQTLPRYNSWSSASPRYTYPSIMPASAVATHALTYPPGSYTRNYTRDYPPNHVREYTPNYNYNYAPSYRPVSVLEDPHRPTPTVPPAQPRYTYTFTLDRDLSLSDKRRIRRWAEELGSHYDVHVLRRDWSYNQNNCVIGFWFKTVMAVGHRVLQRMQDRLIEGLGARVRVYEEEPYRRVRYWESQGF